jgi:hypothetical protein
VPLTAATGVAALPQSMLRDTLAACTEWQTLTGSANAAEAANHIYEGALPKPAAGDVHTLEELVGYRPYAEVWREAQAGLRLPVDAVGATYEMRRPSGVLMVRFEWNVPPEIKHDLQEIDRLVNNIIGGLLKTDDNDNPGLSELNGRAGYLAMREFVIHGPFRSAQDEEPTQGDAVAWYFEVHWGAG